MKKRKNQKRKNYYQVHLNKKPRTVKKYRIAKKHIFNIGHLADALSVGFRTMAKLFRKNSMAAKKLGVAMEILGIDVAGDDSDKMTHALVLPGGEVVPIKRPMGLAMEYPAAPEMIMRKDGTILQLGKRHIGKIAGVHGHLLPVWNPDLYPMPTNQDAINAIERSIEKLGYRNGGHFPLKSDSKFKPTAGAVCINCANDSEYRLKGERICKTCGDAKFTIKQGGFERDAILIIPGVADNDGDVFTKECLQKMVEDSKGKVILTNAPLEIINLSHSVKQECYKGHGQCDCPGLCRENC